MLSNQRILLNDNGTEIDYSVVLNNFRTGTATINYTLSEDYLYIASDLPFTSRYFFVSTPNDVTSTVKVQIWSNAREWIDAVDVIDGTSTGGKSLAQSGIIQWKTPLLQGWNVEQNSEDVTGISKVGIYNCYWCRISWSATLKVTTALKYLGFKFSEDYQLTDYYPDFSNTNLKTAFEAGKTTWDDQHFASAEAIIRALRSGNIVKSPNQILNYEIFVEASIHKTAAFIYSGLGKSYKEDAEKAEKKYIDAMKLNYFDVDLNADGDLSPTEKTDSARFFTR
jgi:hypothetical protein